MSSVFTREDLEKAFAKVVKDEGITLSKEQLDRCVGIVEVKMYLDPTPLGPEDAFRKADEGVPLTADAPTLNRMARDFPVLLVNARRDRENAEKKQAGSANSSSTSKVDSKQAVTQGIAGLLTDARSILAQAEQDVPGIRGSATIVADTTAGGELDAELTKIRDAVKKIAQYQGESSGATALSVAKTAKDEAEKEKAVIDNAQLAIAAIKVRVNGKLAERDAQTTLDGGTPPPIPLKDMSWARWLLGRAAPLGALIVALVAMLIAIAFGLPSWVPVEPFVAMVVIAVLAVATWVAFAPPPAGRLVSAGLAALMVATIVVAVWYGGDSRSQSPAQNVAPTEQVIKHQVEVEYVVNNPGPAPTPTATPEP